MKHQYFLHRINGDMTSDTVVYHVWVGESQRDQNFFLQVKTWAHHVGATFRLWSEDIDFWLDYESERIFADNGILNFGFQRADISIEDLHKLIDGQMFEAFEKSLTQPKVFFSMLRHYRPTVENPLFRAKPAGTCQSLPRKNLSPGTVGNKINMRFV